MSMTALIMDRPVVASASSWMKPTTATGDIMEKNLTRLKCPFYLWVEKEEGENFVGRWRIWSEYFQPVTERHG